MLHASASTYHSNDLCHLIDESIHKTGKTAVKPWRISTQRSPYKTKTS